jgi:hypothetical protein
MQRTASPVLVWQSLSRVPHTTLKHQLAIFRFTLGRGVGPSVTSSETLDCALQLGPMPQPPDYYNPSVSVHKALLNQFTSRTDAQFSAPVRMFWAASDILSKIPIDFRGEISELKDTYDLFDSADFEASSYSLTPRKKWTV